MTQVVYTGYNDVRTLSGADLAKKDVHGFNGAIFYKGLPQEVPEDVANALIEYPLFFGKFQVVEPASLPDPLGVEEDTPVPEDAPPLPIKAKKR